MKYRELPCRLLACAAVAASAHASELVPVYEAPPGRFVADVYAPAEKTPPELFVIDSEGELVHLTNLLVAPEDSLLTAAPRWFVSRRATAYGSADVTIHSDGSVETRFVHREELGQIGEIQLDVASHFALADDGSSILAIVVQPFTTRLREIRAFESSGAARDVPALASLAGRRTSQLALAGDGSRLAVKADGRVEVFDLHDGTRADPLFRLGSAAALALGPSGRDLARIAFDEVIFHRDATELQRVSTDGPAEVAIAAGGIAAVMDASRLQVVRLGQGVLATHDAPPSTELRSVDAVTSGTSTRIAVTSIEESATNALCRLTVLTVHDTGTVTRETFDPVATERWSRDSPQVRLVGTGERAFVRSLDRVWITAP